MYVPDYIIDGVSSKRLIRSLARRFLGKKRPLPDEVRFLIDPNAENGVTEVQDRVIGDTISLYAPTELDRYTVEEVFTERAYSLQGFKRRNDAMDWLRAKSSIGTPLIIDGGANIGASSLLFSRVFRGAAVLAVEPAPRNARILEQNCKLQPAIRLVEAAIGQSDGYAMLSCGDNPRGQHLSDGGTTRVRVLSVESLLKMLPGAVPFMIKLDIEGAEDQLFSIEARWIDVFPIIVVEPHDWKYPGSAKIRGFLQQVAARDRDLLVAGENLVSISNTLIG